MLIFHSRSLLEQLKRLQNMVAKQTKTGQSGTCLAVRIYKSDSLKMLLKIFIFSLSGLLYFANESFTWLIFLEYIFMKTAFSNKLVLYCDLMVILLFFRCCCCHLHCLYFHSTLLIWAKQEIKLHFHHLLIHIHQMLVSCYLPPYTMFAWAWSDSIF